MSFISNYEFHFIQHQRQINSRVNAASWGREKEPKMNILKLRRAHFVHKYDVFW
jgi:hypothetical protein